MKSTLVLSVGLASSWQALASAFCDAGSEVFLTRTHPSPSSGSADTSQEETQEKLRGTVVFREAGGGNVHVDVPGLSPATQTVPATQLQDVHGRPCARAALCFFGRVGSLQGKFSDYGSAEGALEVSAPTIRRYVLDANSALTWTIFAHTWDELLAPAIQRVWQPQFMEAVKAPKKLDSVQSFGDSVRRVTRLKFVHEAMNGFKFDLVVLMRFDLFFWHPLKLTQAVPGDKLWAGHWCSIHPTDLSFREVVLNTTLNAADIRSRTEGIVAPSQFATVGLHDFWFASSSANIDQFCLWGNAVPKYFPLLHTLHLPEHVAHFYTLLHAKALGLEIAYAGVPYFDYTLVRYRHCVMQLGPLFWTKNVHPFCDMWDISHLRACEEWVFIDAKLSLAWCPLAGRVVTLQSGSYGCGRF
eukprot:TRINITY_DN69464_c0_g1_i1.p1 TRINITY_DN69464_c0_g1~~TRINITY_DN69464_c0_g1_i1.p1  ORF type:complete len:413 (-),score=24.37 TRINITY_DN69464_c0_g1_i1:140-1378(-)